ncbi:enoyl-CoA hydratase/isomerase family protein [Sphingobium sp.]|jgi:2-(1,2-epoxy-1,2-dihydrophenyl)acetyl-CoA isomerase|uniref:enoyl-CoA hydratase/isomerase family protein n=1 Tax=Sphingobium sp. TaxID=1912891 RepID=UPI002C8EDD5B|nr:enoyl-CoA hydratase-related protein [Sphingobium sp.]HUD94962.1 enoyl-CoA hydratase-related protein [Sphingobium sp.]
MFNRLRFTVDDGIASIVLAYPEKLNVLSRELLADLIEAFDRARAAAARAVVLSAEGRAFSSGGDLSDPSTRAGDLSALLEDVYHPTLRAMLDLPMPVICAVNGKVVGGACGLVLACDLVIAAEDAVFDFAFARIGLVPDCGLAWLLPRIVGRNRARHILLGARHIGAEQALALGMVERVVSVEVLASTALSVAHGIASQPSFALGLNKQLLVQADSSSLDASLAAEAEAQDRAGKSDDFKALLASMDNRRNP